jgi:plasmid stability protein
MSKMIQVRDVPDEVHRVLKARAAAEGLSLSDYIKRDLEELARQATIEDVLASARARGARERAAGGSRLTTEQIVAGIRASRGE